MPKAARARVASPPGHRTRPALRDCLPDRVRWGEVTLSVTIVNRSVTNIYPNLGRWNLTRVLGNLLRLTPRDLPQ
jgi:hypothetical protein